MLDFLIGIFLLLACGLIVGTVDAIGWRAVGRFLGGTIVIIIGAAIGFALAFALVQSLHLLLLSILLVLIYLATRKNSLT
jgi:hypothetical protein